MASKQPTSRQQRSRTNRARRDALAARTKAASTPREERAPQAPSRKAPAGAARNEKTSVDAAPTTERPRAARLGSTPVDPATMTGSYLRRLVHLPGGLQVLTASMVVIAVTALQAFVKAVPPAGAPSDAKPTRTIFEAYGAGALVLLVPPLVMVTLALVYATHVRRRRAWVVAAFALITVGVLLASLPYLMAGGFLGYGVIRSKSVEGGSWFGEAFPGSVAPEEPSPVD